MAVHPSDADSRMAEDEVLPAPVALRGHLEEALVLPEEVLDKLVVLMVASAVADVRPVEVLAVVIAQKEGDPVGDILLQLDDGSEVFYATLGSDGLGRVVQVKDTGSVWIQEIAQEDDVFVCDILVDGFLPEVTSMYVRNDNHFKSLLSVSKLLGVPDEDVGENLLFCLLRAEG